MPTALRSFDFNASIGVNTHLNDNLSPYGNISQVKSELDYIGSHIVRDSQPYWWTVPNYAALLNAGVKMDMGIGHNPGEELGQGGLQADLLLIDQVTKLAPGGLVALEGLNEPQNFPNLYNGQLITNWTTLAQVQGVEQALLKADPALSGVTLLSPSVDPGNLPGTPANFTATSDLGNAHIYPYGGLQPAQFITASLAGQQTLVNGKADWITEFGYSTTPGDSSYGVDGATQAKNTLNGLLDAFKAGVPETFLYELIDENSNIASNTSFGALGLFNADGSAKPVAVALHNLSGILADTGTAASTFQTGNVNFSISGLPATASQMLLEKSDGTYELIVWNEATDWNPATQSEVSTAPVTVNVNLQQTIAGAKIFDPLLGTSPVASLGTVNSVQLTLTDHPIILQFTLPPTVVTAAAPIVTAAAPLVASAALVVASAAPIVTSAAPVSAPAPCLRTIIGISNTGIRLTGTSAAGSTLTISDTAAGVTKVLGTTTASANGTWSFTSASGLGHIDLSTVHDYSVSAYNPSKVTPAATGDLFLTDTKHDVLTARTGMCDVFAIMSYAGSDTINGFKTASSGGAVHDVINLSGRGVSSFAQVQSLMSGSGSTSIILNGQKSITLTGVTQSSLSAADFHFS